MKRLAVTLADQIREVSREIAVRRRVYAKWIDAGTMKRDAAEKQQAGMIATLETLKALDDMFSSKPDCSTLRTVEVEL